MKFISKTKINTYIINSYISYEFSLISIKRKDIRKLQNQVKLNYLLFYIAPFLLWGWLLRISYVKFIESAQKNIPQVALMILLSVWIWEIWEDFKHSHRKKIHLSWAYLLNYLTPGREERESTISLFFKKKRIIINQEASLINDLAKDIKQFCLTQFNTTAPGFLNFYSKRAFLNGEPFLPFILYSLSIPKRKELRSDSLRKILLSYHPIKVFCPNLSLAFKDYSLNQIEVLYTNPQGKNYINTILSELNIETRTLPVYDSFYAMELVEGRRKKILSDNLKSLDNRVIKNYHFKILLTEQDYENTSEAFCNCVYRYSSDLETTMIRIKYDNKDYACVSIVNSKVDEIKGIKNREIKNIRLIKIINDFL